MAEIKSSDPKESSNPTSIEEEPLLTISETMGWNAPEKLNIIPAEEEVLDEALNTPYAKWKADKSNANLYACTKHLQPTIDTVLATMGGTGNPQIAAKARVITAKAIKTYDPSHGASLKTHVTNQLRQLTRDLRKTDNVTSIPERVQLDGYAIYRAEKELTDELGKEPTVQEIADRAHLSIKRIKDVREKMHAVSTEGAYQDNGNNFLAGQDTDFSQDALDYVYNDSDRMDRLIMEYTTGYGGHKPLSVAEIKAKTGLNDVQISRRKARIALRVKDIMEDFDSLS